MERFNSSFRGYNIDDVNKFVDEMTKEYGAIIDKLKSKDEEIRKLESEIESLKRKNDNNRLGEIYGANEELSRLAKHEARTIIEDAKKNASRIVNDALLEAERVELKADQIRRNMVVFKRRMRTVIQSQLETIDDIEEIKLDD